MTSRLVRFVRPAIGAFAGVYLGRLYLGVVWSLWWLRAPAPAWWQYTAVGRERVLRLGPFWAVWQAESRHGGGRGPAVRRR
jgi:hypothetical protein